MKVKYLLLLLILYNLVFEDLKSQETDKKEFLELESSFLGDMIRNFNGGIHKGNSGIGLFHFAAKLHTENAKFWKGGSMFVHMHKSVGGNVSEQLIGDVQVASNIDGLTNRLIYELWYSQTIGKLTMLAGLHNLNDVFNSSEHASIYLNSSFGISPSLSLNNAISIYPVTTLGALIRWDTEKFSIVNGWYNFGHEFSIEKTFYIKNHLFQDGFYTLLETQYRVNHENKNKAQLKMGITFRHCKQMEEHIADNCPSQNLLSVYFLTDYNLVTTSSGKALSMFLQTGYSARKYSQSPFYIGFGLNFKNIFLPHKGDEMAMAFATAKINRFNEEFHLYHYYENESIIEFTYKIPVHKRINLQPDLQYIINPSGNEKARNAFVGLFRTEINF